jgi:hypothetical protein
MITALNMTGRIAQLLCAGLMVAAARAPLREPGKVDLKVSVLGERERPDGSWEGSDLFARPDARPSRFQLTVHSERDVTLSIDAKLPDGTREQIFPEPGRLGVLGHGQTYALPGPNAFYALEGSVELEVRATPMHAAGLATPTVVRVEKLEPGPLLNLSDGARVPVQQARLFSSGPLRLDLALSSR